MPGSNIPHETLLSREIVLKIVAILLDEPLCNTLASLLAIERFHLREASQTDHHHPELIPFSKSTQSLLASEIHRVHRRVEVNPRNIPLRSNRLLSMQVVQLLNPQQGGFRHV